MRKGENVTGTAIDQWDKGRENVTATRIDQSGPASSGWRSASQTRLGFLSRVGSARSGNREKLLQREGRLGKGERDFFF